MLMIYLDMMLQPSKDIMFLRSELDETKQEYQNAKQVWQDDLKSKVAKITQELKKSHDLFVKDSLSKATDPVESKLSPNL